MSVQTEKTYLIDLTDIKGVGPKTVKKLEQQRITSIEEVHLCRSGYSTTTNNLRDMGVGKDTIAHLQAVGDAIHHSGSDRVKAKHLTGDIVSGKEDWQTVELVKVDETPETESNDRVIHSYSTDRLQSALDTIHSEYPEGYGNQISFEADLGRFLSESETYDSDDRLPQGIIQSVVRYRHKAKRVIQQGDYDDVYTAVLVEFSENLE